MKILFILLTFAPRAFADTKLISCGDVDVGVEVYLQDDGGHRAAVTRSGQIYDFADVKLDVPPVETPDQTIYWTEGFKMMVQPGQRGKRALLNVPERNIFGEVLDCR